MKHNRIDNWGTRKEKLKKEFPELTEDDLAYEAGREEELLLRIQKRLNKNRQEIEKWLSIMG